MFELYIYNISGDGRQVGAPADARERRRQCNSLSFEQDENERRSSPPPEWNNPSESTAAWVVLRAVNRKAAYVRNAAAFITSSVGHTAVRLELARVLELPNPVRPLLLRLRQREQQHVPRDREQDAVCQD